MTVASAAFTQSKKFMKFTLSLFVRSFNSSKCKTAAKMAVARIKLLRNKRQVVVKQMRRDIALLLQSGQDATARIRVEHVMREHNVLAANELIELFCELVVARLSIIAKRRECPPDLKEGIASLIFAAPRCAEIPELVHMRNIFEKKYGKEFVSAATDLRPSCGVNRLLIEKLSVKTPSGELKLKVMKEIAKEYQIEWDAAESEKELLKPPEELTDGPNKFASASSLPVKPVTDHPPKPKESVARSTSNGGCGRPMHLEDAVSAASAAAELAKEALAAAQAATDSSRTYSSQFLPTDRTVNPQHVEQMKRNQMEGGKVYRRYSYNAPRMDSDIKWDDSDCDHQPQPPRSQSYGTSSDADEGMKLNQMEGGKVYRRHSYNVPHIHSDIKWDDSDCDEDIEAEDDPSLSIKPQPQRPAPPVPSSKVKQDVVHRIHPKLPDYEDIAARFEALKYSKSQK